MLVLVAIDLGISARRPGALTIRAAAWWCVVWVGIALGFGGWLAVVRGPDDALSYLAAYLTEESLSIDNVVLYAAVFAYFRVPPAYQHRVLFWGILGAIIMRGAMIAAGIELLARVGWIIYLFGAFLLFMGVRMLRRRGGAKRRGGGIVRFVSRFVPVTEECRDAAFFRRVDGRFAVTPLFITLVVIELSDVLFAVDSLPAVFGVTRDGFLVYTSNLLAVLGLRSLYFLIAGILPRLRYLRYGLAAIMVFIGAKMLGSGIVEIPVWLSLAVIVGAIGITATVSLSSTQSTATQQGPGERRA